MLKQNEKIPHISERILTPAEMRKGAEELRKTLDARPTPKRP
jgi:hypothetical protein